MKVKGAEHYNVGYKKDIFQEGRYYMKRKRLYDAISNEIEDGSAVLDVGCGNGVILNAIKDKVEGYLGIDFSTTAIEIAKKFENKKIKFVCDDVFTVDWDIDYDVVLLVEMLEHIDDEVDILKMIKPGTKVIISVPYNEKEGKISGKPKSYPTHRRIYSEHTVFERYGKEIMIDKIIRVKPGRNTDRHNWYVYVGTKC